jgi:hypothetical protein
MPRQPCRPLSAHPATVRRAGARARRWSLRPADADARRREAADPGRLGVGAARPVAAPLPARDRRTPPRARKHARRQPGSARPLALPYRRSNPRRRDPRPYRLQCLSHPAPRCFLSTEGDIHQAHERRHPGRLRRNAQTARNPRQKVFRENIFGSRQVLNSC